jgi:hypothetical protein
MRLIDADKVPQLSDMIGCAYEGGEYQAYKSGAEYGRGLVDDTPTIDPETLRPTAHWIKCDLIKVEHGECTRYRNAGIECSKCNHVYDKFALWDGTFCPGCGSRMIDCEDGERR